MNDTILINRLPTRTWNRLGVNETALTWGQADDLGEEKITAAGQTERLEITGSGERDEKMVDIHVPAGQTVTVFETLRAEKGLLVRTAHLVARVDRVDLLERQEEQQARDARADRRFRNRQIGRFERDPDDRHDHRIAHIDDDAGQQIARQADGDGANDQKHQHQLRYKGHACSSSPRASLSSV